MKTKSEILEQISTVIDDLETLVTESDGHPDLDEQFTLGLDQALGELKYLYDNYNKLEKLFVVSIQESRNDYETSYQILVITDDDAIDATNAGEIATYFRYSIDGIADGKYLVSERSLAVSSFKVSAVPDEHESILRTHLPLMKIHARHLKNWQAFTRQHRS